MAAKRANTAVGVACAAAMTLSAPTGTAWAADLFIGTGGKTGVYFQVGRAICRIVERAISGIDCRALESEGSFDNVAELANAAVEFGIVRSDVQFHAGNKSGPFEFVGIDLGHLRAVFSVHSEPFTIVARRDSNVMTLDDLPGKRVNIGNPGSGQRATMEAVMDAKGWSKDVFQLVTELPASQQSLALCHGRVQAAVYTVGHPDDSVARAARLCDSVIVEVTGPEIDRLVTENPYYAHARISGGTYPGNPESVETFGVKATLMTSADVGADTVYAVVGAVFDNLDAFKRMHAAFGPLRPESMAGEGLSAPLHEGAERYFREHGLM